MNSTCCLVSYVSTLWRSQWSHLISHFGGKHSGDLRDVVGGNDPEWCWKSTPVLILYQNNMYRTRSNIAESEEVQHENLEIISSDNAPTAIPTHTPWYQLWQTVHWIQSTVFSPWSSPTIHCLNAFITHVSLKYWVEARLMFAVINKLVAWDYG